MSDEALEELTAAAAAAAIRDGRMTAREFTEACLARVERSDGTVGAWAFLDRDHAIAQADAAADMHRHARPQGPLHGVPVGIQDVFDTGDMPTENGTPLHGGRMPRRDSAVAARLREAGAILLGKTATSEFAAGAPARTVNPRDPARTPGGPASGSAAAVASFMVPLAIGGPGAGSVILPASYCGVYGYKPSHGLVPRRGCLRLSDALDQPGVFGHAIDDLALVAECIIGYDPDDADTRPVARPPLMAVSAAPPPLPPRLAFIPSPVGEHGDEEMREAMNELFDALGERVERLDLAAPYAKAVEWHRTILESDIAIHLAEAYERGRDALSEGLRETIERGRRHLAIDYLRARRAASVLSSGLEEVFGAYDAIVTPAAAGVAPFARESGGDPVFSSLWTLCGLPTVTLPLMQNEAGLPLGVQLVGAHGNDARLLRTARWLTELDLD